LIKTNIYILIPQINVYADLFSSEFEHVDDFILCGPEMKPSSDHSGQERTVPCNYVAPKASIRQKKKQIADDTSSQCHHDEKAMVN